MAKSTSKVYNFYRSSLTVWEKSQIYRSNRRKGGNLPPTPNKEIPHLSLLFPFPSTFHPTSILPPLPSPPLPPFPPLLPQSPLSKGKTIDGGGVYICSKNRGGKIEIEKVKCFRSLYKKINPKKCI